VQADTGILSVAVQHFLASWLDYPYNDILPRQPAACNGDSPQAL
jgi:hypothetical protein